MTIHTKRHTQLVAKDSPLTYKAIREKDREADFIASTEAVDSHGEIIEQSSWDLSHFLKNPIVLYGHNSKELPIGRATSIAVKDGRLETTIRFSDHSERALEIWELVKEGTLKAVSVGFLPVDGSYEVRDGVEVWVWRRSILKEISVVPVPANPEALAKMKSIVVADRKTAIDIAVAAKLLDESEREVWGALEKQAFDDLIVKRTAARPAAPEPEPTPVKETPPAPTPLELDQVFFKGWNGVDEVRPQPAPDDSLDWLTDTSRAEKAQQRAEKREQERAETARLVRGDLTDVERAVQIFNKL